MICGLPGHNSICRTCITLARVKQQFGIEPKQF